MTYTRKTADIYLSEELSVLLSKFQNNSELAKKLLRKRQPVEELIEDYVNYISISKDDKTKISYITKERLSQVEDPWDSKRRFLIKPGAFIRKIFKDVSDKDVEIFSALYRNYQIQNNFEFKIVTGEKIKYYYSYKSYASESSSLGVSCMKHSECQDYFGIYTDNQEQISLLVLLDGSGGLVGRSLLWNTELKIMDRIYTINDDLYALYFKRWADENGYHYKTEQKWNNTLSFTSKGEKNNLEISIKLDSVIFDYYPYLDTFKFLSLENKTIYNYIPKDTNVITLSTADGEYRSSNFLAVDIKTGLLQQRQDMVHLYYLDGPVFIDDACYSEVNNCYIYQTDATYNHTLEDYIFIDDSLNDKEEIKERLLKKGVTENSFIDVL